MVLIYIPYGNIIVCIHMKFVKIRVLSNAKKFLHVLVIFISYKQYNVYSHQQNN